MYRAKGQGKAGARPSANTAHQNGQLYTNEQVVAMIEDLLQQEFVNYGYVKVSKYLQAQGFIINKKKTYRLMKAHRLLLNHRIAPRQGEKQYVKYRKMEAQAPYQALQFDIKYMWVGELKRNVFLLTVLDVFTRKVLGYCLQKSVRRQDVVGLWQKILQQIPQVQYSQMRVRSDNGSQFVSYLVKEFFREKGIYQEFCHPATPQEDAHIEAYHSILEREFCQRYEWFTLEELQNYIQKWVKFYNHDRIHASLGYLSPVQFLQNQSEIFVPLLRG